MKKRYRECAYVYNKPRNVEQERFILEKKRSGSVYVTHDKLNTIKHDLVCEYILAFPEPFRKKLYGKVSVDADCFVTNKKGNLKHYQIYFRTFGLSELDVDNIKLTSGETYNNIDIINYGGFELVFENMKPIDKFEIKSPTGLSGVMCWGKMTTEKIIRKNWY